MNLEDLNNEYLRLQPAIENDKIGIKEQEENLEQAKNDLEQFKNAKKVAQEETVNAKTGQEKKQAEKKVKKAQQDINEAITKIENIKMKLTTIKESLKKRSSELENIINEVKSRPEIQEQCNRTLNIRIERQIQKFEKQKVEQEKKKTNLEHLKTMIEKHPQATILFNEIEAESLRIDKIDGEIKKIDNDLMNLDPNDVDYVKKFIEGKKEKVSKNTKLEDLENNRTNSRNKLKKLFNNVQYNDLIDNLTTRKALDKEINNCDRLIRRSENKIKDYTYAKQELYRQVVQSQGQVVQSQGQAVQSQGQAVHPPQQLGRWEKFKSLFRKREADEPTRWEIIKSIFSKQQSLPIPEEDHQQNNIKGFKDEVKLDSNIMKYKVVRDIIDEKQENDLKTAKKQREGDNEGR